MKLASRTGGGVKATTALSDDLMADTKKFAMLSEPRFRHCALEKTLAVPFKVGSQGGRRRDVMTSIHRAGNACG